MLRTPVFLPGATLWLVVACSAGSSPTPVVGHSAGNEQVARQQEAEPSSPAKSRPQVTCTTHVLPGESASCCPVGPALQPEAVAKACGFAEYLGEHADWGCRHSFRTADNQTVTLRVTTLAQRSVEAAINHHLSSFRPPRPPTPPAPVAGADGVHVTAYNGWAWAFGPRSSDTVRVAWPLAHCSVEAMTPTLAAVTQSSASRVSPTPVMAAGTGRAAPPGSDDGAEVSLLDGYASRPTVGDDEFDAWILPFKVKRMAVVLLIAAAHDDTSYLQRMFTPDARWGWADRRELAAQPIFAGDEGTTFFEAFRQAAPRFADKARFDTRPLFAAASTLVTDGVAPMYAAYVSEDGLDRITLRMIGVEGKARIDYVGFSRQRPTQQSPQREGEPPEPASMPVVRVGDNVIFEDENGKMVQLTPRPPSGQGPLR